MPSLAGARRTHRTTASDSEHVMRTLRPPAPNNIISPAPPLIDRDCPLQHSAPRHTLTTPYLRRNYQSRYALAKKHARLCLRLHDRSAWRRCRTPPRRNALPVFPPQMAPAETLPIRSYLLAVHVDIDGEVHPE